MIKPKIKPPCPTCGRTTKPYCTVRECKTGVVKKYTIPKVSKRRKEQNKEYATLRLKYLELFPICQLRIKCHGTRANQIHHLHSGPDRDKYFLDTSTWKSSCAQCHAYLHDHMSAEEAKERGLLK